MLNLIIYKLFFAIKKKSSKLQFQNKKYKLRIFIYVIILFILINPIAKGLLINLGNLYAVPIIQSMDVLSPLEISNKSQRDQISIPNFYLDGFNSNRIKIVLYSLSGNWKFAQSLYEEDQGLIISDTIFVAATERQINGIDMAIKTLDIGPRSCQLLYNIGLAAEKNNQYKEAILFFEKAGKYQEGDCNNQWLYKKLPTYIYDHTNDFNKSKYWANIWIKNYPNDSNSYCSLATLYIWEGFPEEANEILEAGEQYGIKSNDCYPGLLGRIFEYRRDWPNAAFYYKKAFLINQDGFSAWYFGNALFELGEEEEAIYYLIIALEKGPDQVREHANLILNKIYGKYQDE